MGDIYHRTLAQTHPFDVARYGMHKLRRDSVVVVHGGSFMAQLMTIWACESDATEVWILGGMLHGKSLLSYIPNTRTIILFIRNEAHGSVFNTQQEDGHHYVVKEMLEHVALVPNVMVLARLDLIFPAVSVRVAFFRKLYPHTTILLPAMTLLPCGRAADGLDCSSGCGHRCIPGPITRNAEYLAEAIIRVSSGADPRQFYVEKEN